MKLNVNKALIAEAERKAKPVPIPVIKSKRSMVDSPQSTEIQELVEMIEAPPAINNNAIDQLEQERHSVMIERKKLSTRTASLVAQIYLRLNKEGESVAEEFMKGNLADPDLKEHYEKIQSYTDQLIGLYDRIEYVKQNGKPPEPKPVLAQDSPDVNALTWEIRRLDDLIYKLNNKLKKANGGIKQPKNSQRVNKWRTDMAMAEARREDLKYKRKQLRNGRG